MKLHLPYSLSAALVAVLTAATSYANAKDLTFEGGTLYNWMLGVEFTTGGDFANGDDVTFNTADATISSLGGNITAGSTTIDGVSLTLPALSSGTRVINLGNLSALNGGSLTFSGAFSAAFAARIKTGWIVKPSAA